MNSEELKNNILKEIGKGFIVDDLVFDFANNSGFEVDLEDIKGILLDKDHEIHSEITSLIFSPDFNLRKRFAFIWRDLNLEDLDLDLLSIINEDSIIILNYGDNRDKLYDLNESLLLFLNKLGILKKIDKKIFNSILSKKDEAQKEIIALIWTNAGRLNDTKLDILNSYLINTDLPGFFSMEEFSFFLNILNAFDDEKECFDVYISKLFYIYENAYRQALETDNFLKNNNIETFMVQGGRVLTSNRSKLLTQKNHLLKIANSLKISKEIFEIGSRDIVYDKNYI